MHWIKISYPSNCGSNCLHSRDILNTVPYLPLVYLATTILKKKVKKRPKKSSIFRYWTYPFLSKVPLHLLWLPHLPTHEIIETPHPDYIDYTILICNHTLGFRSNTNNCILIKFPFKRKVLPSHPCCSHLRQWLKVRKKKKKKKKKKYIYIYIYIYIYNIYTVCVFQVSGWKKKTNKLGMVGRNNILFCQNILFSRWCQNWEAVRKTTKILTLWPILQNNW